MYKIKEEYLDKQDCRHEEYLTKTFPSQHVAELYITKKLGYEMTDMPGHARHPYVCAYAEIVGPFETGA